MLPSTRDKVFILIDTNGRKGVPKVRYHDIITWSTLTTTYSYGTGELCQGVNSNTAPELCRPKRNQEDKHS